MNSFYELNKKKIKYSYYLYLGLFALIFFAVIILMYINHKILISVNWFIIITLIIIVLPVIFIGEFYYIWSRKNKNKHNLIQVRPYNELDKIGFKNETILKNSNDYKEYIKYSFINDIQILFEVNKPNVAEFKILCDTTKLNTRQFLEKHRELKNQNFILDTYNLKREINHKKEKVSIQEIAKMLNEMTILIKMNNLTPLTINEDGEY